MKKLLTFFIAIVLSASLFSQDKMYILTESIQSCKINMETITIFDCGVESKMPGVFISDNHINERDDVDVIFHLVPHADSVYFITDMQSDETTVFINVISDKGNKYAFLFDYQNDLVTAIFMNDNEPNSSRRLTRWRISNILFVD